MPHMIRWFDHYLKGEDNGVEREPTVRYYVMGAVGEAGAPGNDWRTAADWPPAAKTAPLYFGETGTLTAARADSEHVDARATTSDPLQPTSIPGTAFPGATDARAFEKQAEVRTFTTDAADRAGRVDRPGAGRAVRLLDGPRHRLHRPRQRRLSRRPVDPDHRLPVARPVPRGLRAGGASWSRARSTRSRSTSAG